MYKTTFVNYDDLVLDPKNPRFVTNSSRKPLSKEIMEYLIEFEAVIDLATSIKDYGGLVPGERLLVIKDNDKYIVLEGNRRTAAINLLLEPEYALDTLSLTPKNQNIIQGFKKSVSKELRNNLSHFEVDTVLYRDDAIYSLTERHIDGIKRWSQISKMFFYQQHFDSGKDLQQMVEFTGETPRTIADTLRKYSYLRFVLSSYRTKYPNGKFNDSRIETQIPTELIIRRVFNSLKDRLQLKFDSNYKLLTSHYTKSQLALLNEVFADISYLYWDLDLINTRNLNKVDDFQNVFFNPNSEVMIPEALCVGELIIKLEKSLQENILNNNIDDENFSDEENVKGKNAENKEDTEGPKDENIENEEGFVKPKDEHTENAGDPQNPQEENKEELENIEEPKRSNGRLRDPESYKYLTGAYQLSRDYKTNPRINKLKKELSRLEYKDFTISAMYLIRSLLETYTHEYIDYFANLEPSNNNRMKSIAKRRDQRRDSLQILVHTHVNQHLKNVIKTHPETQELIETTLSNNNNTALTQIINHHIHSTNNSPDRLEVLEAWSKAVHIINTLDEILFENQIIGQQN